MAYESDFEVSLGSLQHPGVASASLLACDGDFGAPLDSLFVYDGDFVATLGSLGGHFWHLKAALGLFWGLCGSTCGICG